MNVARAFVSCRFAGVDSYVVRYFMSLARACGYTQSWLISQRRCRFLRKCAPP